MYHSQRARDPGQSVRVCRDPAASLLGLELGLGLERGSWGRFSAVTSASGERSAARVRPLAGVALIEDEARSASRPSRRGPGRHHAAIRMARDLVSNEPTTTSRCGP